MDTVRHLVCNLHTKLTIFSSPYRCQWWSYRQGRQTLWPRFWGTTSRMPGQWRVIYRSWIPTWWSVLVFFSRSAICFWMETSIGNCRGCLSIRRWSDKVWHQSRWIGRLLAFSSISKSDIEQKTSLSRYVFHYYQVRFTCHCCITYQKKGTGGCGFYL